MQVVIDIHEKLYEYIAKGKDLSDEQIDAMAYVIADGTLLPKGHGRVIDGDKLRKKLEDHYNFWLVSFGSFKNMSINDRVRVDEIQACIAEIVNADTIIEADKEET